MPEYYDDNGNQVDANGQPLQSNKAPTLFNQPKSSGTFQSLPERRGPQGFFDNAMDFSMGLMGFPSARTEPSNAYNYGEMTQTGLPIIGGLGAGIYGLRKMMQGNKAALPSLNKPVVDLNTPITKVNIGTNQPIDSVSAVRHGTMEATIAPVMQTPVQKLGEALKSTIPLNQQQKAIYRQERSEKLAEFKSKPVTSQASYLEQKKKLGGEYAKVEMTPIKLEQADVDDLFRQIGAHPKSIGFNQIHASDGLSKLLTGAVPTESEVKQLTEVFGKDFIEVASNLKKIDTKQNLISEAVNLPRAMMASYDLSAPLRQGLPLIHRKEYWNSFGAMFKSGNSDKAFREVQKNIVSKPTFDLMQEHKLALTDLHNLSNKEEAFISSWAESGIPLGQLGRKLGSETAGKIGDVTQSAYASTVGRGVGASNRAYVGFLNKLRADTFDTLVNQATASRGLKDPHELDPYLIENIAKYVNNATGRGSIKGMEESSIALNSVFFSPRLIASRLQMLNPNNYINPRIPAEVRKEYLKSLFAVAGFGLTVTTLGQLAGGEVINDPTSSDFRKVKFGNTRLDPNAGFQQYIVAASKLLSGQSTSPVTDRTTDLTSGRYGGQTRFSVLFGDSNRPGFLETKLNPALSFVTTLLRGKDFTGQPVSVSKEVATRFVPLALQDIYELSQENPGLLPVGIPSAMLGMGTQTFGDR